MNPNYRNQNMNTMGMYGSSKSFAGQDFMEGYEHPPEPLGPSILTDHDNAVLQMFWANPDQPLPSNPFGYQITSDQSNDGAMDPSSAAETAAGSSSRARVNDNHMQSHNGHGSSHDNSSHAQILNAESYLDNNDINAASTLNGFKQGQFFAPNSSFALTDPIPDQAAWGSMPVSLNFESLGGAPTYTDTRPGPGGTQQVVLNSTGLPWAKIVQLQQPQEQRESLLDFFPQQQPGRPPPPPHAFGSDVNFTGGRYQAIIPNDHDAKVSNLLGVPLAEHASATRGPPLQPRHGPTPNGRFIQPQHSAQWVMAPNHQGQGSSGGKRRRSGEAHDNAEWQPPGVKQEYGSDDEANSQHKRQRSYQQYPPQQMMLAGSPVDGDGNSLSRKKENLTEIQKRKNHILSEKKRREIINTGYHDLNNLVPCLANGKSGLSRSECLNEIFAYLVTLETGTAAMLQQLGLPASALEAEVQKAADS